MESRAAILRSLILAPLLGAAFVIYVPLAGLGMLGHLFRRTGGRP
jgi:hypothetical protein